MLQAPPRALRFEEYGDPQNVLHLEEQPCPAPGGDEVLVRVRAAAINPSDVKNVEGAMRHYTTLPRTPGRDFAGVVVEGPERMVGQEVWGTGGDLGFVRDGTHAEYLLLPAAAALPKPAGLSFAEAAAAGVAYVTAASALLEKARMEPGESVLVIGGRGAVGSAAAQIAHWRSASALYITTRAGEAGEGGGLEDAAIRLPEQDIAEKVREWTGGRGVDVVLNAVGGATFEPAARALADRGRMVCITAQPGDARQTHFDLLDFYRRELRFLGLNTLLLNAVSCARILGELTPGFEAQALHLAAPPIEIALDRAPEAYRLVQDGTRRKVVLTMP